MLHLGQCSRVLVGLGARGGDVHAQPVPALAGDHDRGTEFRVGPHVPLQPGGELRGEGDAVPLHGKIHIESRFAQQEVPDGPADEVAAAHAGGDGLDVPEEVAQAKLPQRPGEVHGHRRGGLTWRPPRDRVPGDRAEELVHPDARPVVVRALRDHREPAHLVLRQT